MIEIATLPLTAPSGRRIDNLEDAEVALDEVILQIRDIEYQLGDGFRKTEEGVRFTGEEYEAWRSKAKRALLYKQRWASRLRQYIRQQKQDHYATRVLLRRAYVALLEVEGLTNEEKALVWEIGEHLKEG